MKADKGHETALRSRYGNRVAYRGLSGQQLTAEYKFARYLGLSYMEIRDAKSRRVLAQPIMGRHEAQSFFANLKSELA